MSPLASIVVTAFDRKEALKRLLIGLDNQSAKPDLYEVIVADDSGDTRLGEQVTNALRTRYELSLIRTHLPYDVNGVSVARNLGIQKARGKIIISIDDDCFPGFFFVEEHIKAHKGTYPVIVLGHRSGDPALLKADRPVPVNEKKGIRELVADSASLLDFSNFMTGNISLPRKMVIETGLFNETFAQKGEHGYEDIELGYRLWRKGVPTVFARDALIYRPDTEPEKEQKRAASSAREKASHRFLNLHPLLPMIKKCLNSAQNGNWDEALSFGMKIISEDPGLWPVLLIQAEGCYCRGQFEKAEQYLSHALQLYDMNPAVHLKLAQLRYRQNRFDIALSHTLRTLEMNPRMAQALYLLAFLRHRLPSSDPSITKETYRINIELGGGARPSKIRAEGHDDYINFDVMPYPAVDVRTDFNQSLPIPDGVVDRIFSREMITNLPYKRLPEFIKECFRVLKPGGEIYLCCPDFESIMALYHKQCACIDGGKADPDCLACKGAALISNRFWRRNLLGAQTDFGDGGVNDTHKNQISFPSLAETLREAGFVHILREHDNPYYEVETRIIKLSVKAQKPG